MSFFVRLGAKESKNAFWSDSLGSYALALDRQKRPCLVKSCNAGQCLFTGIALPERASLIAQQLLSSEMFSGWGVRTLGALHQVRSSIVLTLVALGL